MDPNIQDKKGNTVLHLSFDMDARLLLLHGAKPNIVNNEGKTPLDCALDRMEQRMKEDPSILGGMRFIAYLNIVLTLAGNDYLEENPNKVSIAKRIKDNVSAGLNPNTRFWDNYAPLEQRIDSILAYDAAQKLGAISLQTRINAGFEKSVVDNNEKQSESKPKL